ncbi:EF-hand domain-containing protein [Lysobacter niastensis]|uniref:EF-hand domain-containing protein n=1 Tax=Lysobacter niastensis TaxID=380629 RepID=A0ABS0B632_9GAMM|nr:EF-hand domain-containing protein [Lysobacter niastensis]MBF6024444.1 EF-hand domain-containing protein [Lysobacter niastensis]
MSRNTPRNIGALGVALAGLVLTGSAFAMQPLAQGYMLAAGHAAAEGKCGEGQCGDEKFAQVDTDNDALVSRAEFLAVAPGQEALFAQKDVNRDGYISEKESYDSVKAAYETHGKKLPSGLFANPPRK